jgi:hypothetical protein
LAEPALPRVAFVASGKLHVCLPGAAPEVVESAFVNTVQERAREIQRRHAWKGAAGGFGALAWGRQPQAPGTVHSLYTGLSRGPRPGTLVYSLEVDRLGAVCQFDPATGTERRLMHGSERRLRDLCARADGPEITLSVLHPDGSGAIAVMSAEATDLRELTEGDSVDLGPAWADDGTPRIVYQSAGVGRDGAGRPAGFGPFEIHALDLRQGEVTTLAAESGADLVQPRLAPGGALYYLRRPHGALRGTFLHWLRDALLFVPRLFFALFQYLNFFAARYTGKPLTTAGGPERKTDLKRLLQWANLADADQVTQDEEEAATRVPASHRIERRRTADATAEALEAGVACYDVAADGTLVFATTSAIYIRTPDGRRQKLCDVADVEQLAAF